MRQGTAIGVWVGVGVAAGLGLYAARACPAGLFLTPDQRGDRLARQGRLEEAARTYSDPMRQGVAWYRAGKFDEAARAFARAPGAPGAYNQGNALVMRGAYDQAIAAYDRALERQPGWAAAEENRALAAARRDRLKHAGGDETGEAEGEETAADDTVVDLNQQEGKETLAEGGASASDAQLSELWLRRVQTTPGGFLRAKFAYQAATKRETR